MNTSVLAYDFEQEPVRVALIVDAPWFVATDVAKVLGYRDAANLTRNLHEDEKGTHIVSTLGGTQEMTIISESGLYAAIFKSQKEEAQRFRKWVTAEVLPSIRRTGRFELPAAAAPPAELAVAIDVPTVSTALNLVREARRLFGTDHARRVWIDLGLPQPIADALPSLEADPLLGALRAWLADRDVAVTADAAAAIGLDPAAVSDRRRTLALIRAAGWRPWTKRIDGQPRKCWVPAVAMEG